MKKSRAALSETRWENLFVASKGEKKINDESEARRGPECNVIVLGGGESGKRHTTLGKMLKSEGAAGKKNSRPEGGWEGKQSDTFSGSVFKFWRMQIKF